jgi:DNA-binding transcriptional ArsR family regulator
MKKQLLRFASEALVEGDVWLDYKRHEADSPILDFEDKTRMLVQIRQAFKVRRVDLTFIEMRSIWEQQRSTPCRALGLPLHVVKSRDILNHMVQYIRTGFDASFAALSDATRRGVLEQLGRADASITDLAEKFHMTLTGMKKHVGLLEQAGLVATQKVGRVRTCKLGPRRLEEETAWIERYRELWAARFDELDKVVEELKQKEKVDECKIGK